MPKTQTKERVCAIIFFERLTNKIPVLNIVGEYLILGHDTNMKLYFIKTKRYTLTPKLSEDSFKLCNAYNLRKFNVTK